jgi:hypothetical protein
MFPSLVIGSYFGASSFNFYAYGTRLQKGGCHADSDDVRAYATLSFFDKLHEDDEAHGGGA